ncbi:MAG: hypothetical protein ACK5N8_06215 [Alphaproteobacteria bacterium]
MAEELEKDAENEKAPAPEEAKAQTNSTALIKNRFEINFDAPIEWLHANGAKAFEVRDRVNAKSRLFALVCDNKTVPRFSLIDAYKEVNHDNIMALIDNGIVSYPSDETQYVALIYRKPLGGKLIKSPEDFEIFMGNDAKLREFLLTFVSICESLKNKAIPHRAIRLDNIYYNDVERKEILLGDCIASMPAFYQPDIYEPIESLLAIKEGRFAGSSKDDIYALGVLALSLFLGKKPLNDLTTQEILTKKIELGSYQALSENESMPGKASNIFRKLLDDDKANRWSHVDLYNSLDKHIIAKTNPKSFDVSKKSIIIDGKKLYSPRSVAFALISNPKGGYELIKDGKIVEWIKTGLQNEELYVKADKTIRADIEKEAEWDILVSKIIIMLAPSLPIIFRGINVFPSALSKALYYTMKNKPQEMSVYHQLIESDLFRIWHQEQQFAQPNININEIKLFASRNEYGYGIYRVMYELDEDIPCTSPLVGKFYVNSHTRLLKALDDNYDEGNTHRLPFDKNLIAYIYANLGKSINKIILNINSKKESEKTSNAIKLYSIMQDKYGPAKLVNLGKWLINSSQSIIDSYHNIKYRKVLEAGLEKLEKEGNITAIYNFLENDEAKHRDGYEYTLAIKKMNSLSSEKKFLMTNGQKILSDARNIATNIVAIAGIFTMIASFVFSVINWMKW